MNWEVIILFLIIFLILAIAILAWGIVYFNQNPHVTEEELEMGKLIPGTIITHTYIGKRGQMGNQLFQIAAVVAAAKRSHATYVLPTIVKELPLAEIFPLADVPIADLDPSISIKEFDTYEEIRVPSNGKVYDIRGYRQSYHYFDEYRPEIRTVLAPDPLLVEKVRKTLGKEPFIAVHVRKGDYEKWVHNLPLMQEFKACKLEYYREALKKVRDLSGLKKAKVIVVTDSPKEVSQFLDKIHPDAKLSPMIEGIRPMVSDFITLYLANALVISNSTFSWWAAYLMPGRKVICPSPWWDPRGFIGKVARFDSPHLHYPEWHVADAENGTILREAYDRKKDRADNSKETFNIIRMFRGMFV